MISLWRKRWFDLTIALVGGTLLISSGVGGEARASPPTPSAHPVVTATADGLLVEWRAPEVYIVSHADGTVGVLLPDYLQTAQPGTPRLPFISVLVAVPPGTNPSLRVVLAEESDRPLPGRLALAPFPKGVQRDAAGHLIGGDFSPALSVQPVQSREAEPVHIEPAGVARGVRLVRLVFYPARPIGSYPQERLRVTTHVRVSITFEGQADSLPGAASLDPFLAALRSVVINPEQVQPLSFNTQNPPVELQAKIQNSIDTGPAWSVEVALPGLIAITYEALAGSGYPVASTDPRTLRMTQAGTEIAIEWDGDEDANFEAGERLLFYAAPRFSRWTSTDIYLLWQDGLPGLPLRMQNRPTVPLGQPAGMAWVDETAEINQLYTPDCFCGPIPPGRDGDHWTWDDLKRPGHSTASYSINLPTVDATQPATLTVWLIGYTDIDADPDHRVDVDLNGASVGRIEWNGRQPITTRLTIMPGILYSNINTLTLSLPGMPGVGIEGAWLDAFSIRYGRGNTAFGSSVIFTGQPAPMSYTLALSSITGLRVYDITSPERPLRLTDVITAGNTLSFSDPVAGGLHRYALAAKSGVLSPVSLSPVQLLQTSSNFAGADDIMIAPAGFIPALDDLIGLRQTQGLIVAIENVQAIYDAYGDGRPDPAAIRAYLANAYATWTPRPTYVVLVGDGSFDPRQYRPNSPPTFIPPYLANVDPWAGETAADNRYVAVDGQDALPDMLIGRLPVKSLAETQTVVSKIVQYEINPFSGGWNENVTFVADNADEAGDFAAASEMIASTYVTSPFSSQRIYFTPPATMISTTRQAVLDHLNAGALIVQYTGHSSWRQWATENFLSLDDVPALHNDFRWPIVVEMTCFTSAFHRPESTLDEALLTHDGGGAIATWGSTGLGVSTGQHRLDDGFFRTIFSGTVSTLGQAIWAGKLSLATSGQHLDLLDTYTLLGDPALRPNRTITPWASHNYLPVVIRNLNTFRR